MSVLPFGQLPDGTAISEIRLTTAAGASASIITLGATVRDLVVPLPNGETRRVVLGYPTLDGYLADTSYLGATAGRYASRIGGGRFRMDGTLYQLTLNEGNQTHLHGGTQGFSHRPWQILSEDGDSVTLSLISPDGDQGYPGTVEAHCTYRMVEPATLRIVMTAITDAPTIVNLAHHSYFSLNPGQNIRSHLLRVNANYYTPVDTQLIPTGEIHAVAGTPYDFRHLRPISDQTGDPDFCYDLHFVLDRREMDLPGQLRFIRQIVVYRWNCTPPSLALCFMMASTSSRPSPVSMAGLIQDMMGFAWSRNGFRTAQTTRGSARRCCDQEKRTARLRSIDSW